MLSSGRRNIIYVFKIPLWRPHNVWQVDNAMPSVCLYVCVCVYMCV